MEFFFRVSKLFRCKNYQHYVNTNKLLRPPPIPKSTVSEKTSKLSFYYRKMQQTFLFQNIYNLLKKDQILTDFSSQHWAYPTHFFEQKWCVQLQVSPWKQSQSNFITLTITIHSWLPSLLFTAFCPTFSTVSYLDMLFRTKKKVKDIRWVSNEKY